MVWIAGAGAAIFLAGTIFFFRWAIQQGWLGAELRFLLGLLAGGAIAAMAAKLILGDNRRLGVALLLAGLGTLQFTFRAGAMAYHFYPAALGLAAAALVTLVAGGLAARGRSGGALTVALVSGLAAPLVFSQGGHHEVALTVYLAVLMAATLAVPYLAGVGGAWHGARWTALIGTWLLLLPACAEVLKADAPLLGGLLVLHLALAGCWAWLPGREEKPGTPTVLWLIASILATSYGWLLWKRLDLAPEAFALPVLAIAALNLALVKPLRGRLGSRQADWGLLALAAGHLALAVPVALAWRWVGPLWGAFALGMAWASMKAELGDFTQEATALRWLAAGMALLTTLRWAVHGLDGLFFHGGGLTPFFNAAFAEGALASLAWFLLTRRGGPLGLIAFLALELTANVTLAFEAARLGALAAGPRPPALGLGSLPGGLHRHDTGLGPVRGLAVDARPGAARGGPPGPAHRRLHLDGPRQLQAHRVRPGQRGHAAARPGLPGCGRHRHGGRHPRASAPPRGERMKPAFLLASLLCLACARENTATLHRRPIPPAAASGWARLPLDADAQRQMQGAWIGDSAGRSIPFLEAREGLWEARTLPLEHLLTGKDGEGRPTVEFSLKLPEGWQVGERETLKLDFDLDGHAPWVTQVKAERRREDEGDGGAFIAYDPVAPFHLYDLSPSGSRRTLDLPWDGQRYRLTLLPSQGDAPRIRGLSARAETRPEALETELALDGTLAPVPGRPRTWRLTLPDTERVVGLDLMLAPPVAPLAPDIHLGESPETEQTWACGDLVWNLPALRTRSTRIALTPRLAKTITLSLPEGATPQSLRVLVRQADLDPARGSGAGLHAAPRR